jgi:phage terminase large subunit-like protein
MDDPHKEGDALSPRTLVDAWVWYGTAARTRLAPGGWMLFPMTRWHPQDLAGRVMRQMELESNADRWEFKVFSGLALEGDALGREPGAALWPARFDASALHAVKAISASQFEALYQQNPQALTGKMFNSVRVRLGDFPRARDVCATWCFDLALGQNERADYNVWARTYYDRDEKQLYLEGITRRRQEWPETKADILALIELYPEDRFVFEHRNIEILACQELRQTCADIWPGRTVRIDTVQLPTVDKTARAAVASDWVLNGRVIACGGENMSESLAEMDEFPGAEHDDFVDVLSLASHVHALGTEIKVWISEVEGRGLDFAHGAAVRLARIGGL